MQYVRYLKTYGSKTKGQIEQQPDMIAHLLADKGLAEFSYDPVEQAEIDAVIAEVDADKRGEEVGLTTFDDSEDDEQDYDDYLDAQQAEEEEAKAKQHDSKPPVTRARVRRAIQDSSNANKASLSDDDISAGAEYED